jgi:hypothetical protein
VDEVPAIAASLIALAGLGKVKVSAAVRHEVLGLEWAPGGGA